MVSTLQLQKPKVDDNAIAFSERGDELFRELADRISTQPQKHVKYTDAQLQHGTMYFNDARGLHQTVRRKTEGLRISVDFRFRRKHNEDYRAMVPPMTDGVDEDMSIPYSEWLSFGEQKLVVFDETLEQAKQKNSTAFYLKGYRVADMY